MVVESTPVALVVEILLFATSVAMVVESTPLSLVVNKPGLLLL